MRSRCAIQANLGLSKKVICYRSLLPSASPSTPRGALSALKRAPSQATGVWLYQQERAQPVCGKEPPLNECATAKRITRWMEVLSPAFSFPFFPSVACVLLQVESGTNRSEERHALKRQATKEKQKAQHRAFPRGPPPQYYPGSNLLNFAVRMGSGEPG